MPPNFSSQQYLEANAEVAADRLAEVLPYYPDIRAVVRWSELRASSPLVLLTISWSPSLNAANVRSFVSSMILLVFFIINSVLSGIVAFKCGLKLIRVLPALKHTPFVRATLTSQTAPMTA